MPHRWLLCAVVVGLGRLAAAPAADPADTPGGKADDARPLASFYRKHDTWQSTMTAARTGLAGYRGRVLHDPDSGLWRQVERDFPVESDWLLQDLAACGVACSPQDWDFDRYPARWFGDRAEADIERRLILKVAEELGAEGNQVQAEVERLEKAQAPPHGGAWLDLYVGACQKRRAARLRPMLEKCTAFVFTKHYNMGGSHYAYTEGQSDAQAERHFVPGAALCRLEMQGATAKVRTLLEDPNGVIRDPDVSYDGRRVLFAWKKSDRLDDYHLHEIDLASGKIRQLTFGLGFADYEGAYLPDGDILFNSTRCVQTVDCFHTEVSNLYTCDRDGHYLRRLGFDQVHSNFPTVTEDGRILYTRWEYNDRGQIFPQALFQMNSDGTGQTEFYGNNSWFPTTILHARNIFGTQKVLAIATGHHSRQTGKLIVLDPARGRQENSGAQLVAPVRETKAVHVDSYGQEGELFQYPYPLSETEYLVTYNPWGWRRQPVLFGIYFMTIDGRRELLAADPGVSCNQSIPLRRSAPRVRPNQVNYAKTTGAYYVQDVYAGPGLKGIARGTAKKLRVVALDFRAAVIGGNHNGGVAGGAFVATPVAIAQGCWDPKIVLGETEVCDDGSAFFTVPVRTPVYFQVLDAKGCAIQTMRSWSTLQPGENGSCVGCHESKNSVPLAAAGPTAALRRGPKTLDPFYGPARGFSFAKEIQPILDRHCTNCHSDRGKLPVADASRGAKSAAAPEGKAAFSLLAEESVDRHAKRRFSDAYLALTGAIQRDDRAFEGVSRPVVNWISPQSAPPMLPPYSAGAAKSGLMTMLEEGHENVRLSKEEMEKLACWIDLVVPFCGDYLEAAAWSDGEKQRYEHFLAKRRRMEAVEAENIRGWTAAREREAKPTGCNPWALPDTAVRKQEAARQSSLTIEVLAVDGAVIAQREQQASPESPLVLDMPRPFQPGDRIRLRGAEHLAVQFDGRLGEAELFAPRGAVEFALSAAQPRATPYPPEAFRDDRPRVAARPLPLRRLDAYRNLALNPYDLRGAVGVFPHATASSEWWQVDFGRMVEIDKIVLLIRAEFPHDRHWRHATLVFSDGERRGIALEKTAQPQSFSFRPKRTCSLRLADLVQDEPLGWCALTEVEVWGRDPIPVGANPSDIPSPAPREEGR